MPRSLLINSLLLTLLTASLTSAPVGAAENSDSVSAHNSDRQANVLDPEKFFGQAQIGYAAAKKVPEICAKLFCYCGCDITDHHSSLLDCFTSDHGVDCSICQEEAILALKYKNSGKSIAEIQKAIDLAYTREYEEAFPTPSQALLRYRRARLWQAAGGEEGAGIKSAAGGNTPNENDNPHFEEDRSGARKINRVIDRDGSCCGHK